VTNNVYSLLCSLHPHFVENISLLHTCIGKRGWKASCKVVHAKVKVLDIR
jgi:hypothetical protein